MIVAKQEMPSEKSHTKLECVHALSISFHRVHGWNRKMSGHWYQYFN